MTLVLSCGTCRPTINRRRRSFFTLTLRAAPLLHRRCCGRPTMRGRRSFGVPTPLSEDSIVGSTLRRRFASSGHGASRSRRCHQEGAA